MKVYKIEILIVDHDKVGEEDIKTIIENARYPNRCIMPEVMNFESVDIEWNEQHPLNLISECDNEYKRLFK